jgi:hypothetical protein
MRGERGFHAPHQGQSVCIGHGLLSLPQQQPAFMGTYGQEAHWFASDGGLAILQELLSVVQRPVQMAQGLLQPVAHLGHSARRHRFADQMRTLHVEALQFTRHAQIQLFRSTHQYVQLFGAGVYLFQPRVELAGLEMRFHALHVCKQAVALRFGIQHGRKDARCVRPAPAQGFHAPKVTQCA